MRFFSLAILSLLSLRVAGAPSQQNPRDDSCPANAAQPDGKLPGGAVSPSLLMQISRSQPNRSFPPSNHARVSPGDDCTIFNLQLDAAATQGKTCTLVFDFPAKAPHNSFIFQGPGSFIFNGYAVGAGAEPGVTTWNNQPADGPDPINPPPTMLPGHSYVINSAPCGILPNAGTVTVSGSLCSPDTLFEFDQDGAGGSGCPMGFFVILSLLPPI